MTDEPRRRGRPAGSKNKPKEVEVHEDPNYGSDLWVTAPVVPAGLKIVIVTKRALSREGTREVVEWLTSWPLPHIGDGIAHGDVQGPVRSITFDLNTHEIVISVEA